MLTRAGDGSLGSGTFHNRSFERNVLRSHAAADTDCAQHPSVCAVRGR